MKPRITAEASCEAIAMTRLTCHKNDVQTTVVGHVEITYDHDDPRAALSILDNLTDKVREQIERTMKEES